MSQAVEPILQENKDRFVIFPIQSNFDLLGTITDNLEFLISLLGIEFNKFMGFLESNFCLFFFLFKFLFNVRLLFLKFALLFGQETLTIEVA